MTTASDTPGMPAALADAWIDPAVMRLRPDYRALLVTVTGVQAGPSDDASDAALCRAEQAAQTRLAGGPPESLPQVAGWREAFLAFGVKPRQARSSLEALLRRVDVGLPRINRLTDLYNAVSLQHLLPVGGENLDRCQGPPRLVVAAGGEPFDTIADGDPVTLTAEAGEVVWRDDDGATCRRWNWRQCVRTRLDETTSNVLFILDALETTSTDALHAAAAALAQTVTAGTTGSDVAMRLLPATP